MVSTIRLPAYAELLVDSMDRYQGGYPATADLITSSSSWTTALPSYALNGYFTRLAITQIQFQWNLPTILEGWNDVFYVQDNDLPPNYFPITIAQGFYTPSGLATALQQALNTGCPNLGGNPANWTVAFTNGVFVIEADDFFQFADPATSAVEGPAYPAVHYARCLTTIGLLRTNYPSITIAPPAPQTRFIGGVPSMLPTRFIDMCSSYLTKFQDVKDSSTSTGLSYNNKVARIYAVSPASPQYLTSSNGPSDGPYYITVDYATPKMIMWNPDEAINNFDIQLRDEFGDLIPFSPIYGCEYAFTLYASET